MQNPPTDLRVGDPVRLRGQRWRIRDIRGYSQCRLVTLDGAGPTNHGCVRRFLTPFDRLSVLGAHVRPQRIGSRQWRRAVRALLVANGPADALRTAAEAAIDLLPHQLEPAVALLRGLGTRVLLADEVGLGKTVQAGLAIAELRARGLADRILIATPAGLRDQWREELSRRFSLDASLLDARELRRRSSLAPLGVNPWTTVDIAVTSIDFVKRPEVLPAALDARWDVVVVDEAHGALPQTDRHAAVSTLCRRASYVLLLTATPHSGDHSAFDALCQLGGNGDDDPLLVFRRTRREVSLGVSRRIHRLLVTPTAAERRLYARLADFARAVRAEHGDNQPAVSLALGTLFKRAISSPWSLARSVDRRLAGLETDHEHIATQISLPFDFDGDLTDVRDEPPIWTVPSLDDPNRERRLLEAIADAAGHAVEADSKLAAVRRLLRRLLRHGESAIVFTEYRDTLIHLQRSLDVSSAVLHGGLTGDERLGAVSTFTKGHVPVLLATDAAGEGINLQATCRVVINLELPWNPNRLEQRAGRVDRIGQTRTVHAFHLIAAGAGEMRVLDGLRMKIQQARMDIDTADPLDISSAQSSEGTDAVLPVRHTSPVDVSGELERLVSVRRLLNCTDPVRVCLDTVPLIAVAPKRLRASLRGQALALVCSRFEDPCGRLVALRLSSALIQFADRLPRFDRDRLRALARQCEQLVSVDQSEDIAIWASHTRALHEQLLERRLRRDAAVYATAANGATRFQPGLFDRRVEQQAAAALDRLERWRTSMRERIAQLERSLRTGKTVNRLGLLLVP